jgi:opacity protein-like surface antigen
MLKRYLLAVILLPLLALPASLHAQASYTATRGGILQVGGAYSNSNSDEFANRLQGITVYSTFDITRNLGVEGDLHLLNVGTPDGYEEKSYMFGGRYVAYRHRGLDPYGKFLIGIGSSSINRAGVTAEGTPGTYFAYGVGAGLDLRLAHNINVRAIDFEYQRWPSFPAHALTPTILSFGVAYRLR